MSLDLTAHLHGMTRTVRNLQRDGQPAKAVIASCVYDTDPADLDWIPGLLVRGVRALPVTF